jgi:eukaryotic-like serine/threonine-protein kinase
VLGDSVRRRQPGHRSRSAEGSQGGRRWRPLLLALPVAVLLPFIIGYLVAVYVIFPPLPSAGDGIAVPDLVGESAAEAQRALAAAGLGPLDVTELPHPTAPAGEVVAQSPLPGQQLRPGAGVLVALSAGRPRAVVPDVTGFSASRAESLLQRAGFEVVRETQESPVAADRVLRTDPAPGQERAVPSPVTLIVSSGPAPVEPDTMPGVVPPGPGEAGEVPAADRPAGGPDGR